MLCNGFHGNGSKEAEESICSRRLSLWWFRGSSPAFAPRSPAGFFGGFFGERRDQSPHQSNIGAPLIFLFFLGPQKVPGITGEQEEASEGGSYRQQERLCQQMKLASVSQGGPEPPAARWFQEEPASCSSAQPGPGQNRPPLPSLPPAPRG